MTWSNESHGTQSQLGYRRRGQLRARTERINLDQ